jgi:hypothetical protein
METRHSGRFIAASFSRFQGVITGELSPSMCSIGFNSYTYSCSPNAIIRWDVESFSMAISAVRDIDDGAEITIGYTNLLESRNKRKTHLQEVYGFDCCCTKCLGNKTLKKTSNTNLGRILEWLENPAHVYAKWLKNTDQSAQLADVQTLNAIIDLFDTEEVQALRSQHIQLKHDLACMHGALGNKKELVRSLDWAIAACKPDFDWSPQARRNVGMYEIWKTTPESFPHWQRISLIAKEK